MTIIELEEPVYTAGPMTGLPERNYPFFRQIENNLKAAGFTEIENPCWPDDSPDDPHPWEWYMRRALEQVIRCKSMILLPGWEKSRGATVEHYVATQIGIKVYELREDTEFKPVTP